MGRITMDILTWVTWKWVRATTKTEVGSLAFVVVVVGDKAGETGTGIAEGGECRAGAKSP